MRCDPAMLPGEQSVRSGHGGEGCRGVNMWRAMLRAIWRAWWDAVGLGGPRGGHGGVPWRGAVGSPGGLRLSPLGCGRGRGCHHRESKALCSEAAGRGWRRLGRLRTSCLCASATPRHHAGWFTLARPCLCQPSPPLQSSPSRRHRARARHRADQSSVQFTLCRPSDQLCPPPPPSPCMHDACGALSPMRAGRWCASRLCVISPTGSLGAVSASAAASASPAWPKWPRCTC